MDNMINKFDDLDFCNVELEQELEVNIDYSCYKQLVNETLKNGLGIESEVERDIKMVGNQINKIESVLSKIKDFEENILKLKKVMEDDLHRLEKSIDKEVTTEFYSSYEVHCSTWKPYDKWEETRVIAKVMMVENKRIITESGNEKIYRLNLKEVDKIFDVWSNRKEFNKEVKELAKQYNAVIKK